MISCRFAICDIMKARMRWKRGESMRQSLEERKRAYDAVCKNVLAVLANILKECVEEFQKEWQKCAI